MPGKIEPIYGVNNPKIESNIDWKNLKIALENGAKKYLSKLEKDSQDAIGLIHGDAGVNRAYNLLLYISAIDQCNHFAFFALTLSIIESSSIFLAACIEDEIIKGVPRCKKRDISFIFSSKRNNILSSDEKKQLNHQVKLFEEALIQDATYFNIESVPACEMTTIVKRR